MVLPKLLTGFHITGFAIKLCYHGNKGYTDRQQRVITDGASSYSSRVTSGVLQGMVLTAHLFFYVL